MGDKKNLFTSYSQGKRSEEGREILEGILLVSDKTEENYTIQNTSANRLKRRYIISDCFICRKLTPTSTPPLFAWKLPRETISGALRDDNNGKTELVY